MDLGLSGTKSDIRLVGKEFIRMSRPIDQRPALRSKLQDCNATRSIKPLHRDDPTSQIEPKAAAPTPVFAFTPETSPIGAVANPNSETSALRQELYAINKDQRPATPETDHLWRRDLSM
jgi:hypothetical protein